MYAIFVVLVIYLIVPILGLALFVRYRTAMLSSGVDCPSMLGFGLAMFTSPVAIGLIIYDLRKKRQLSEYHALAYKMALLFFPAIGLMMAISIVIKGLTS